MGPLRDDGESREGSILVQVVVKGRKFRHDTDVEIALPENVFVPKYSCMGEGAQVDVLTVGEVIVTVAKK
jgi:hypothetical protein